MTTSPGSPSGGPGLLSLFRAVMKRERDAMLWPMTEPSSVPPGWYPDPNDGRIERWWNGTAWTEPTRALPPNVPAAAELRAASNGWATTSVVLSALSLVVNPFLLLSILGVIFGAVGLARSGSLGTGRTVAIVGLALGLVVLVGSVLFLQRSLTTSGF